MRCSEQINELGAALAKAQAEFTAIPKTDTNPFFKSKYAALPQVVEIASPILAKHGLSVSQFISSDGEDDTLTTWLIHSSGQYIADTMRLYLPKKDSQGQGSATTYARRYAYMAALGLVADVDDDANATTQRSSSPAGKAQPKVQAAPVKATVRIASSSQRGLINVRAREKRLDAGALANVLLAATDQPVKIFESEEQAKSWLARAMDRLPATAVDPVLEIIAGVPDSQVAA